MADGSIDEVVSVFGLKQTFVQGYCDAFHKMAIVAQKNSDDLQFRLLRSAMRAFSVVLQPLDDPPFIPECGGWTHDMATDEDVANWTLLVEKLGDQNAEASAQLADLLWTTRRHQKWGRLAFDRYLTSAGENADWKLRSGFLGRAARLLKPLGNPVELRKQLREAVEADLKSALDHPLGPGDDFRPHTLLEILVDFQLDTDWPALARKCEEIAKSLPIEPGVDAPRDYYELAARCLERAKDTNGAKSARAAGAKFDEDLAGAFRKAGADPLLLAHFVEKAARSYQKLGGHADKVKELLRAHRDSLRKGMETAPEYSTTLDLSDVCEAAQEEMRLGLQDHPLKRFLGMWKVQELDEAKTRAKADAATSQVLHALPTTVVTQEGNVAKHVPGGVANAEERETHETVQAYSSLQGAGGVMLAAAARELASGGERLWKTELDELLKDHPLIPVDHRALVERAIDAGFQGDGVIFAHIAIPQVEFALRRLSETGSGKTTKLTRNGAQQEIDLNELLREPVVVSNLGQGLTWELRTLLIEQAGSNLRHRMCHGLLPAAAFEGPYISFLLWLVLIVLEQTRRVPVA